MSTLRISNIEAKSVPASATVDEKVKITNSSGDTLVFLDGKTSGITTVGINTTDGNITFDANSNVVVTGIITATRFSGQITPTSLEIGSNIKLGNAGVITATSFVGSGANLTSLPSQLTLSNNADNRVITGGSGVNLNGESTLTYNGTDTFELQPASATPAIFIGDSNRTGAGQGLAQFRGNWNGTTVARITFDAGDDTTNKDDGIIRFDTAPSGSLVERLRIDSTGRTLVSGTLGYGNMPFGGNPANAAIQIRCNSKYNGIAFGENAVSGCIGLGGADTTTAMVFTANAHPANLGGGTKDIFEWWSGNAGGGGPSKYMTLDTGGHLALTSGNLEFANGAGIDFSAVPDGSRSIGTDGNKFDDYEEGSWTPTIQVQSGSFSTFSYQEQQGHYIKVGKLVTIFLRLRLGTVSGSGSGNVYIHSLPYVNHNINNGAEGATFSINYYSHMGGLGNRVPVGYVQQNLSQIVIVSGGQGNGTTSWNANNLNGTNGWQVYGVASYQTA